MRVRSLLLVVTVVPTAALSGSATALSGSWTNPARSVRVALDACGTALCGRVTWASAQAIADAREGGVVPLIGRTLLETYTPRGPARWQGRVFVPDWNRSFWSTIDVQNPQTLKISGCILHGLLCKSQLWTRL